MAVNSNIDMGIEMELESNMDHKKTALPFLIDNSTYFSFKSAISGNDLDASVINRGRTTFKVVFICLSLDLLKKTQPHRLE